MNQLDPKHPWNRLVAAARQAPDDRDTAAPYGFATRVSALAFAAERGTVSLFERLSLRALGIACLLTVGTVAANYSVVSSFFTHEEPVMVTTGAGDDPVAELVDVASNVTIN